LPADRLREDLRPVARAERRPFAPDRARFVEAAFLPRRADPLRADRRAALTRRWTRLMVRRTLRRAGAVRSTTAVAASAVAAPSDCAVDVAEPAALLAVSITVRVALPMMLPTTSADLVNASPVF
jgi:hypothetical protein